MGNASATIREALKTFSHEASDQDIKKLIMKKNPGIPASQISLVLRRLRTQEVRTQDFDKKDLDLFSK